MTIDDIYLSNMTFRNAEIVIFDYNDFTTLQKLIDNADGTLTLTKDYTFNQYMDVDFAYGVDIDKNITIDGAGFTLNGNNQVSILNVQSAEVTIKNINFINANTPYDGGAFFCDGGYAKLTNCTFINNNADSGAAVYLYTNADLTDCTFINNTAREYGGAVYIYGKSNVTNCSFTDNKLTGGFSLGGAVYFNGGGDGTLTNCNFTQNNATYGGTVYYFDGNSTVTNCNFINNTATDSTGAISIVSGSVTNCNFINNTATGISGAIGIHYGNITNCNFTNNSADEGGAIYLWMGGNEVSNCVFTDNFAQNGGAMYCESKDAIVYNCNFAGNAADNGGAIYNKDVLNVENSQFGENDAEYNGGAIYSNSNMTVVGCQFNNNYAGDYAGAIIAPENLKVINSNFTSNRAFTYAGAIYVNNTVEIGNCNFVNNTAGSTAGAVLVFNDLKVTNSTFTDNYGEKGGAIAVATANISYSNFTSNNADYGGAIYAAGNITMNNCEFKENAAESEGGAISFRPEIENSILSINGSTFTKNKAVTGGALAITENSIISSSNFINNTAEDGSDNVVTYDDANVTLENVSPENLTSLAHVDLTAGALNVKYGNPVEVRVALTKDGVDLNEGSVSVTLNNKVYSANVVNGFATIKIPNLNVGVYSNIKVTYDGNGKYTNSFDTVRFTVSQLKTKITAASKTYVINYGGKYSVTLKDENGKAVSGKTITLTINGKKYKATSNSKGVATFKLTKAMLKSTGSKKITIKFAGDTNYAGSTATVKIKVKKEKTKILKAKKTYKFKKSKKTKNIKVVLKNSKNKVMKKVKVTIKLSGKKIKGKKQ